MKARNVYENEALPDSFKFTVLAPWYLTWWAILLYVIGGGVSVYVIVKWRARKLVQEKQLLELTVKERTKELGEKNRKLSEQSRQLKEMAEVKSRFFANISHEFRTPLTLIMGPLEQMISDKGEETQQGKFKVMLRNSRRLLRLINQLLDLSRFDSGKTKLKTARQDIVPFIKGILASFQILARKNKLELQFYAEPEEIVLYYEAQKMEEVMYNLLINAVKFSKRGGKITVTLSLDFNRGPDREVPGQTFQSQEDAKTGEFVKISVKDTGIGIAPDQLSHIFDRFFQAKGLTEKGGKGTGIGLALTRELVLLHHGKIDVHSREGKGTEFEILLPMGKKHLKTHEISTAVVDSAKSEWDLDVLPVTETTEETSTGDIGKGNGEHKITGSSEFENGDGQEKNTVLVVEDN
ncbi:MAG: HAMP domain-containing histidine kinase, partial [bacterium]|nr:HAMP domain-containing histidine kinase [bacterium]